MRWMIAAVLVAAGLAGCTGDGAIHVIGISGNIVEKGPEYTYRGGVCDVAPPHYAVNPEQQKVWYVVNQWYEDPITPDVRAIRFDQSWEYPKSGDDCTTPWGLFAHETASFETSSRHQGDPGEIRLAGASIEVEGHSLRAGQSADFPIERTWTGTQHGTTGTWTWSGTITVTYLGKWSQSSFVPVESFADLPGSYRFEFR